MCHNELNFNFTNITYCIHSAGAVSWSYWLAGQPMRTGGSSMTWPLTQLSQVYSRRRRIYTEEKAKGVAAGGQNLLRIDNIFYSPTLLGI